MGSLPNLRSLSNDPNTTYKYELCEPDELPRSTKSQTKQQHSGHLPRLNFNSQREINGYKIHQNVQLVPHFLGNAQQHTQGKNHHHKVRLTRSSGSQYNYYIQNNSWEDYVSQN